MREKRNKVAVWMQLTGKSTGSLNTFYFEYPVLEAYSSAWLTSCFS